ncbi:MAG: DUF763 domain-containing protein [Candidatus Altiarchaeales archaeon]|nr:DUF763 domain-containing protein [Candidatus Altiarchaeota archaeon]MBU4266164.1 DUF763 domain-containing protein [Candidatus Altiarchaeota archaeon]MBU4342330.1 DUF763 domain-containing protein [Candidatus Altiarchaeota archaeon]MBU4437064.1 DUF763 domain-containing protein [Candidatus Altiarchaeota archaeon]MCG2783050.1 DUF763 domain-containing protein [Candidatus Altiarchaeales archaeon]
MKRTGTVNLPLHGGKAPRWLFNRMVKLAGEISDIIIYENGQDEFLRRISNPYWFQAFSCVLGYDWHASGTTTVTTGALKVAINPEEFGLAVCGGKGGTSRKTPGDIEKASDLFSLSSKKAEELINASKLSAKVDSGCVQDSYQLYHHCFFLTEKGDWAVVQQGMNDSYARRYHWLGEGVNEFVNEPHAGICCDMKGNDVLDLTASDSKETRKVSLDLVKDNPVHLERFLNKNPQRALAEFEQEFTMPEHHPVLDVDIGKAGMEVIRRAYEIQPGSYEELISLRGMGPKRIRALALISDLLYGTQPSWQDPVKYSFTHGGKDGFPYFTDRRLMDESTSMLKDAVEQARIGRKEKLYAIKRLKDFINE